MDLKNRILSFSNSFRKKDKDGLYWVLEHGEDKISSCPIPHFESWYRTSKPSFFRNLNPVIKYFKDNPNSCLLFRICPKYIFAHWACEVEKINPWSWNSSYNNEEGMRAYRDLCAIEGSLRNRFSQRLNNLNFFKDLTLEQIEPFLRTEECRTFMQTCADLQIKVDQLKEEV